MQPVDPGLHREVGGRPGSLHLEDDAAEGAVGSAERDHVSGEVQPVAPGQLELDELPKPAAGILRRIVKGMLHEEESRGYLQTRLTLLFQLMFWSFYTVAWDQIINFVPVLLAARASEIFHEIKQFVKKGA